MATGHRSFRGNVWVLHFLAFVSFKSLGSITLQLICNGAPLSPSQSRQNQTQPRPRKRHCIRPSLLLHTSLLPQCSRGQLTGPNLPLFSLTWKLNNILNPAVNPEIKLISTTYFILNKERNSKIKTFIFKMIIYHESI